MFRTALLALAATAGLIGTTEFSGSEAKANPPVIIVGHGPYWPRPIIRVGGPVIYTPPVVVATPPVVVAPPPVVVAPVCHTYSVFYRSYPNQPWILNGTFASPALARQTANGLAAQGFSVYQSVN